jgi:predicted RNA-binding protein with PUA-like domain
MAPGLWLLLKFAKHVRFLQGITVALPSLREGSAMSCWLMKSEPDELSIHDLQRLGRARWDGVRNYQARNFLRAMQPGELFFFYHSSCPQPGIAGVGRIASASYADPTALDPQSHYFDVRATALKNPWSAIDVEFVAAFATVLALADLKASSALLELPLVHKGTRLSVMPVTLPQWQAILALSGCTEEILPLMQNHQAERY